jgi:hypothetical protein
VRRVSQTDTGLIDQTLAIQVESACSETERRRHDRSLSIFRLAKLTAGKHESLCVARNLSPGGMMVEVLANYGLGQKVCISLADDDYLESHVVWQRGLTIGIRFDSQIDVMDVLTRTSVLRSNFMRRMPRMPFRERAQLRVGSRALPIEICDISPRGARIKTVHPLADHEMVWVIVEGLDPICGTLRWRHDGYAGIEFSNALLIARLMQWLRGKTSCAAANMGE